MNDPLSNNNPPNTSGPPQPDGIRVKETRIVNANNPAQFWPVVALVSTAAPGHQAIALLNLLEEITGAKYERVDKPKIVRADSMPLSH